MKTNKWRRQLRPTVILYASYTFIIYIVYHRRLKDLRSVFITENLALHVAFKVELGIDQSLIKRLS